MPNKYSLSLLVCLIGLTACTGIAPTVIHTTAATMTPAVPKGATLQPADQSPAVVSPRVISAIPTAGERPLSISSQTPEPFIRTVYGENESSIRSGPGNVYPQIGMLKPGDRVQALGKSRQGEWIKIAYPEGANGAAWVYSGGITQSGSELPVLTEALLNRVVLPTGTHLLSLQSSPEEIRNLILNPIWKTAWVEGQTSAYIPKDQRGSLFIQAWLEREGPGKVISSDQIANQFVWTPDIKPRRAWLSDGKILQVYDLQTKSIDPGYVGGRWVVNPLEWVGGMRRLLPYGIESLSDPSLQILRQETFAGRSGLVIDWGLSRYWVDEVSGLLLRAQDFSTLDHSGQPEEDTFLRKIVYDPTIPPTLLNPSHLDETRFENPPKQSNTPQSSASPVETPTPSAAPAETIPPPPTRPIGEVYFFVFDDKTGSLENPVSKLSLDCLSRQEACPSAIQSLKATFQHNLDGSMSWSPDGKMFALVSYLEGNPDITVANADGSDTHNLTNSVTAENDPIWSPDGAYILYRKALGSGSDAAKEIWITRPDGTGQRKVADGYIANWSADGQKIYYASANGKSADVHVVDRDASKPVLVANLPEVSISGIACSPAGKHLLVSTFQNLVVMNLDGSNRVQLAPDLVQFLTPTWSPDGQRIAFFASASILAEYNVYTIRSDGSGLVNISDSTLGGHNTATWSPDGKWLAYGSRRDSGYENIFVSNPDGSEQYRLTHSNGSLEYLYPSWRP